MPGEFHPGERVRLVSTTDPYTQLQPGMTGTVLFTDAAGTVHVSWENGSSLGLIPGEDVWERITLCTRCGRPLVPGCCPTVSDPAWWAETEEMER